MPNIIASAPSDALFAILFSQQGYISTRNFEQTKLLFAYPPVESGILIISMGSISPEFLRVLGNSLQGDVDAAADVCRAAISKGDPVTCAAAVAVLCVLEQMQRYEDNEFYEGIEKQIGVPWDHELERLRRLVIQPFLSKIDANLQSGNADSAESLSIVLTAIGAFARDWHHFPKDELIFPDAAPT